MSASDYMPQKDGDFDLVPCLLIGTSTKTVYEAINQHTTSQTFYRVKAQKGDAISDAGNVVGV